MLLFPLNRFAYGLIIIISLVYLSLIESSHAARLYEGISFRSGLNVDVHVPDHIANAKRTLFGGKKTAPVVLYVHGGGWAKGSRKRVYKMPQWLTRKGYVFVAMDYRKVPSTTIDGQVNDLVAALSWVRRNIKRYGGDPKNIVLMGHSAGAHLVALAGAQGKAKGVRGIIPNDVQAYDLVAYATKRGSIGAMFGKAFSNNPRNWVKYSPSTYARRAKGIPPHLILYSKSQGERRSSISVGYGNLLKSRGTRVTMFDGRRYSHGAIAARLGRTGDPASAAIERFLRQVTR